MALTPQRGEAKCVIGGEPYRLVFDAAAWFAIERAIGKTMSEIIDFLGALAIKHEDDPIALAKATPAWLTVPLIWGAFQKHHPEIDMDIAMGLQWHPDAGAIAEAMMSALEDSLPQGPEKSVIKKAKAAGRKKAGA